jgi:hypothetical protein
MNLNDPKISDPFNAPKGYFEDFEKNLLQKMNPKVRSNPKISIVRRPIMEYVAIAATLTAIMATAYVVFFNVHITAPKVAVKILHEIEKPVVVSETADSAYAANLANKIVDEMLVQPENINPIGKDQLTSTLNPKDELIALELEEAGLIVMDANDGLFDTFEL